MPLATAAALGIARANLIWMDLQGAELLALQGMGDLLNGVRYVHTELSFRAFYTGQGLFAVVLSFLHTRGLGLTTGVSGRSRQMGSTEIRSFKECVIVVIALLIVNGRFFTIGSALTIYIVAQWVFLPALLDH